MQPAKYYEYTAYFDFETLIEYEGPSYGIISAVYAQGGRPVGDGLPFIAIEGDREDRLDATVRLYIDDDELEFECQPIGTGLRSFFNVSYINESYWSGQPETLPRNLQAYRVETNSDGVATLSMERPGTVPIRWEYPDNELNYGQTVFYTVRVVDQLPESAFSPVDLNRDGEINFFDVSVFIELYLNATN